jgi:hypothetical protein
VEIIDFGNFECFFSNLLPESPNQYKYRSLSDEQLADLIKEIPRSPLLASDLDLNVPPVSIVRKGTQSPDHQKV